MGEEKKFYTVQEATEILGISEKELMKFIDDKKIPVLKVGRALRISQESIKGFFKESDGDDRDSIKCRGAAKDVCPCGHGKDV